MATLEEMNPIKVGGGTYTPYSGYPRSQPSPTQPLDPGIYAQKPPMTSYPQPQAPWRPLPEGLPMVPWYQNLQQGTRLPTWQGPSTLTPYPSAQYWGRMAPSERSGFQGLAETMGVYWPDYYWRMKQNWPKWSMPNYPRWGAAWW